MSKLLSALELPCTQVVDHQDCKASCLPAALLMSHATA